MTERHADFEALSAYVDGEAPEWADHVEGCAACRGAAADIRSVASAVSAPVGPPDGVAREAAIAAAMEALSVAPTVPADRARPRLAPERPAAGHRWASRPWAMPAVAAVVIAVLGFSGLILTTYRSSDNTTTVAGGALESDAKAGGGAGVAAAAPTAPPADLGDIADAATLRNRAQAAGGNPPPAASGRSSSSSNSGAQSDASAVPGPTPAQSPTNSGVTGSPLGGTSVATGGAGGASGSATNVVGTRPCEERARSRDTALGPVVYFATARQGSVPAYVLGFSPAPGTTGPAFTLLLLSQGGCAELLRAVGP